MPELTSNAGELVKLTVEGFKKEGTPVEDQLFTMQFNPSGMNISYYPTYCEEDYAGKMGSEMQWNHTKATELQFKFNMDKSLVNETSITINKQIDSFKAHTINYQPDTHEPPLYTEICWGEFTENKNSIFRGRITQLDITYTQFKPSGEPLRAELSVAFKEYKSFQTRLIKQNNSSPDMTHRRTVQAGDTLLLMTQRIYGDTKYYKQVATHNKLTSLRTLEPGTQLIFPPLES
tara:strand:+ start:2388 stop:3086 length:699 start_codon:yes stop_codon:yes gene_type:complete